MRLTKPRLFYFLTANHGWFSYNEIVQYHMDANEYEHIIAACRKYGDKDRNLWVKALSYFASITPIDKVKREMEEVLSSIERDNILPPLQVIQILSQSETATLGLVKVL